MFIVIMFKIRIVELFCISKCVLFGVCNMIEVIYSVFCYNIDLWCFVIFGDQQNCYFKIGCDLFV